mmetsp:Transcript_13368/g.35781  ORF Transcript_13368/g.35781 Transcript_13368/m.35781 type:complete len:232 (-) Transcript_13368:2436-3131(-)
MPSPSWYFTNRRTLIFSPTAADTSLIACSTVLVWSAKKGWGSNVISWANLAVLPSAILARMASGLDLRSSRPISISRSRAYTSAGISSGDTYSTDWEAAICMPRELTSWLNASLAATKSVSQLTSSITPSREPGWMYLATTPSAANLPAFLSALARPFLRSQSEAFSMSMLHSARAFLQSIMPAPDLRRSSCTALEETCTEALGASGSGFFSSCLGAASDAFTSSSLALVC